MKALAIENDRSRLDALRSHLRKHGLAVDVVETLAEALPLLADYDYEIILLGVAVPDREAARTLSRLHQARSATRIIVLSARADSSCVAWLDAGADDFLAKPFDFDELVARIRAAARRGNSRRQGGRAFADIVIDQRARQVMVKNQSINLRRREAMLLEALVRRADEPVHREVLLSSLYSDDEQIESNALDVHIHNLRRRLAEAGSSVRIATVRGYGYVLRASED